MEKEESLQSTALIGQFTNAIQNYIYHLFADSVVSTSIIISSILLSCNQLFRMEQLSVSSSSYFVNNRRFQIDKNCPWHVLASPSFGEKSAKRIVSSGFVRRHCTVGLKSMFKTI